MTRLLVCAAVAVAAGALASPASASELCVGVEKSGTVGPPFVLGPACVPYSGPPVCRTTDLGVAPTYVLHVETCTY